MQTTKSSTSMATERQTASKTCKSLSENLSHVSSYPFFKRRYTSEGKAVYMVAALGVVMDTQTGQQSFYGGN